MRIGEVSKSVGITVEAIRFYEKEGLIDEIGLKIVTHLINDSVYGLWYKGVYFPEYFIEDIFFWRKLFVVLTLISILTY